jgi:UDP:flavonoid glycosyltransferase YjiC (YdhE family)
MRIVLTTYGSLGDLHPYLALALELQQRGHTPVLATSELYRERITNHNLEFAPVRPDLPSPEESGPLIAKVMHPVHGPEFLFRHLIMPHLRDSYEDLSVACQNADLLISHPITFAAPVVAEVQNIPWLSTALAPISLWSLHDPPVPPGVSWGYKLPRSGKGANALLWQAARFVTGRWLRPVQTLRAEHHLRKDGHPMFDLQFSPHGTLAMFSSALATAQPDWPPNITMCGFGFYDTQSTLAPELQAFFDAGEPPIVFTLGSAAVYAARDFFAASARAARRLKRRALFLIGEGTTLDFPLTPDEQSVDYAPHAPVFARAAVVVHQGGIGTTAQALRAGVPQLVVPFSHDQPDNAARIDRLGCGRFLPRTRYNAERAQNALQVLLHNAEIGERARSVAAQVRAENGVHTACDVIEKL